MIDISKRDWKLFQEKVPEWQEHYMERLVKEYIEMMSAPGKASEHFWDLEKRIKEDRKHPGVILDMRKSDALWNIVDYIRLGVITEDELDGFSPELIDAVKGMSKR